MPDAATDAATVPSPPAGDLLDLTAAEVCGFIAGSFDPAFYLDRYADMRRGYCDPLEHYAIFGWKEGRDPCDWFSTSRYLSCHVDVADKGVNPLLHYVLYGQHEGRRIWPVHTDGRIELQVDPDATLVADLNLRELMQFPQRALRPPRTRLRPDRLVIHWLIPDFAPGSGGHMTIFRLVRWLEFMGHDCSIWITAPTHHTDAAHAYDDIVRLFQTIRASVAFCRDGFDAAKGDVVVATGWQTVARALNAVHFRTRCYLVQDFEASFHAMGSRALMAEWTYTQDLGCICAGPWLARTLRRQFGRWTRQFDLALEHEVYYPSKDDRRPGKDNGRGPRRSQKRIVLYARSGTARRAVELALLALEHLAANGADIHVDLFGEEDTATRAPFPCVSHGILNAKELAELYRGADIGICFSATNYSLVPQEMMACGLPVVEIDAESTRAVFPDGVVTFAGPHPLAIASDLSRLLQDAPRRRRQAAAALAWVAPFNWEASARAVERSLLERLGLRPSGRRTAAVARPIGEPPKVTVCIPTYNGGRLLRQVVARVRSQRAPWPFDMVIIDSSSTDGSIRRLLADAMPEAPPLQVATIAQAEFQHGRTRNLCADMARGELVAFLTQDALPADDFWLYNLVTMLERFPRAAGAFGRHVAWPSASPFVKRELDEHFAGLARAGLVLSRDTDRELWRAGDPEWRQVLHFFSDNNACLRRCIWQQVPYPELVFGEDQAWADGIIRLGYEKVYVPSAVVYHSHDHGADEAFARAETEAQFFAGVFGYQVYDPARGFDDQLAAIQYADTGWARSHGISQQQLERQLVLNEARLRGRASGARRALEGAGG